MADKAKFLSASDLNKVLPTAVAERFQINSKIDKIASTRSVFAKHGTVDFKTLSLARAEQLVKQQAPWIEEKAKTPADKTSAKG